MCGVPQGSSLDLLLYTIRYHWVSSAINGYTRVTRDMARGEAPRAFVVNITTGVAHVTLHKSEAMCIYVPRKVPPIGSYTVVEVVSIETKSDMAERLRKLTTDVPSRGRRASLRRRRKLCLFYLDMICSVQFRQRVILHNYNRSSVWANVVYTCCYSSSKTHGPTLRLQCRLRSLTIGWSSNGYSWKGLEVIRKLSLVSGKFSLINS